MDLQLKLDYTVSRMNFFGFTVLQMKEKIERELGIPIARQILILNNKRILRNEDTMDYVISGSTIQLILGLDQEMWIYRDSVETVEEITRRIEKKFGIPRDLLVLYSEQNVELHPASTLPQNHLPTWSCVFVCFSRMGPSEHYLTLRLGYTDSPSTFWASKTASASQYDNILKLKVVSSNWTGEIDAAVAGMDNVGILRNIGMQNHPPKGVIIIHEEHVVRQDKSFALQKICDGDRIYVITNVSSFFHLLNAALL